MSSARANLWGIELPPLPLAALYLAVAIANCWYLAWTLTEMVLTDSAADWMVFTEAARHGMAAGLYNGSFRWSPLLVPVMQLATPMGLMAWRLLHVIAAFAMPSWRMRILVLASWPFWFDLSLGNVVTYIVLAAGWALRGNQIAAYLFLVLSLLIPRPLMLPVAAWLLWRRPQLRWPFAAAAVLIGIATLATGLGMAWFNMLFGSISEVHWTFNIGPSRWIGLGWLVVGIPLAIWLTWRGRVSLASIAVSPYVLPYYLLFAFLPDGTKRGDS
jgi:hypothetical protein